MFLKVMHNGADEFLDKAQSDATHSLFSDVTECHFRRYSKVEQTGDGPIFGEASVERKSPTNSAVTFSAIQLTGDAFLMNDQGRTISKFRCAGCGAKQPTDQPTIDQDAADIQKAIDLLRNMPSTVALAITQTAIHAGSLSARFVLDLLNRAGVAEPPQSP